MVTFLLTAAFLAIMIAAMAVGVIFANKPIKGSCGGMQSLGLVGDCDICGGDKQVCEDVNKPATARGEFYDAGDTGQRQ